MINKILPLSNQSFLNEVNYYKMRNRHKFKFFREIYTKMNIQALVYFHISGVHTDLSNPYLDVDPHKNIGNNKVV